MENKRIIQGFGFDLLYADTDAVLLQRSAAPPFMGPLELAAFRNPQ
jgi:hypothetical protein